MTRIRKTQMQDIDRLHEIFESARRYMASTGNPNQWHDGYPSTEQLRSDIESGDSYVMENGEGRIVATFLLRGGEDPTYANIDGQWPNNNPYATIHRIASSGETRGVFNETIRFALEHYTALRIDTHEDNKVMQRLIANAGFEYCGIIHCWNGEPRLAYALDKRKCLSL